MYFCVSTNETKCCVVSFFWDENETICFTLLNCCVAIV